MAWLNREYLKEEYWDKQLPCTAIAKQLGCSEANVRYHMRKLGITRRNKSEAQQIRTEGYHQNLPNLEASKELAYILGVLDGDGWISVYKKNYQYKIGLEVTEEIFTNSFRDALKFIGLHPTKCEKHPKNGRKQWLVQAGSKRLLEWLQDGKTKIQIIKNYPEFYLKGLYESDGCLSHRTKNSWRIIIYSGNKATLEFASHLLKKMCITSKIECLQFRRDRPKNKPLFSLVLSRDAPLKFLKIVRPCIKNGGMVTSGG